MMARVMARVVARKCLWLGPYDSGRGMRHMSSGHDTMVVVAPRVLAYRRGMALLRHLTHATARAKTRDMALVVVLRHVMCATTRSMMSTTTPPYLLLFS